MIKAVIFDCYGVILDVMRNEQQTLVLDFVRSLKGAYKLGMVSNVVSRSSIDRHFQPGELDTLFDVIVASGEVGIEKPDPRIYRLAAEKLGVAPEECLFIDDIGRFCAGAEEVGMQSITFFDPRISIDEIKQHLESVHADQR